MSLRLTSRRILLPVLVMGMFFAAFALSPAHADIINSHGTQTTFTVLGTSYKVNLNGQEVDSLGRSKHTCPFIADNPVREKAYIAAVAASKQNGDADGCPMALDTNKNPFYFDACKTFYKTKSEGSATVANPSPRPNTKILNCMYGPGYRSYLADQEMGVRGPLLKARSIKRVIISGSLDASKLPKPVYVDLAERKRKQEEADKTCYDDSLKRIDDHFAKLQSVQCFKSIKKIIKNWSKDKMFQLTNSTLNQVSADTAAVYVEGAATAITSIPSPPGLVKGAAKLIKLGADIGKIASDADTLLTTLSQGCGSILPGLRDLQNFKSSLVNSLSCQAIANLVERQLTQCIRVDFGFDVRLPQFSMSLQCPININLSARFTGNKWNCYSSVSTTSPIQGNFGGRSLLSGNGGLAKLFDSGCFKGNDDDEKSVGGFTIDKTESSGADRIAGVDCGPLSSDPIRSEAIKGKIYLTSGTPVTSGWVVGATETSNQPTNTDNPGNGVTNITRCDYFENKRVVRTAYVYGSGASCNNGASAFLDGGFETNDACYNNNYTPAALPNVAAACLYPAPCLDSNGNFSSEKLGVGGCPSAAKPVFNANSSYTVFSTGGLSGGDQQSRSCKDFNDTPDMPVQCCDPQTQDCNFDHGKRNSNTPLCVCDTGDAANTIIRDQTTGKLDQNGACTDGGNVTCCSPRLNGQDWCEKNMGAASICEDEKSGQCVASNTPATYVGIDGRTQTITAGDLITAKPSPYMYLFVRPDATMSGQQCCMTEWCNICPQHYANAYGLSLIRSTAVSLPPTVYGNVTDTQYDRYNNALLGKGWPYISQTNSLGVTTYQAGVNPMPFTMYKDKSGEGDPIPVTIRYPQLMMSPDTVKPLSSAVNTCNGLSPWQVIDGEQQRFDGAGAGSSFAYITDNTFKTTGGYEWFAAAKVPNIQEMPLAYMNRIRASVSNGSTSLPPIPLCSEAVKICTGDALGSNLANTPTTSTNTGGGYTKNTDPTAGTTPVTTTNTGESTTPTPVVVTPTTKSGATEVPSVSGGQANGALY